MVKKWLSEITKNRRSDLLLGFLIVVACAVFLTRSYSSQLGSLTPGMMLASDSSGNPVSSNVSTSQANAATATKSWSNTNRSLNSSFQISTTRDALVSYSVDIASTLSLVAGQTGTVYLEYADDSSFTLNITTICQTANGNTGALTIGLNLTQTGTATLSGLIPSGKYAKLVTENTSGTPTFTYKRGQEVLF